jgi:hypothetical protein
MSILLSLSCSTKDKSSNAKVIRECLDRPVLIHSIAEGLRTGNKNEQLDCALILVELSKKHPDLLTGFVGDFLKLLRAKEMRMVRLGLSGLIGITSKVPTAIYAERGFLLSLTEKYGATALDAATVLAQLCLQNAMYRGQLSFEILKLLAKVPEDNVVKWLKKVFMAFSGSTDLIKKLHQVFVDRAQLLSDETKLQINAIFTKKLKSRLLVS